MTTLIHAEELTKRFDGLVAVNQVNLRLEEGEVLGIIGPNGSGKTTLFNLLSGYFPPSEGAIFFAGKNITEIPAYQRVKMGMARTFQLVSVFDSLKVWENLVLSNLRTKRVKESPLGFFFSAARKKATLQSCQDALDLVGLASKAETLTYELSYGDKRMLEIAIGISLNPRILLLDEPLAGLSDHEIGSVLEMINRVKESFSLVVIEHKISKIVGLVQKLIVMNEGKIISEGSTENCLGDPKVRECYWGKEE
ncbi:MAG: ABC transporter ATP-binding protein [Syntrophobacteraceae bacterium]|jgi:branched-chain amino acid transport system ATP-binding protein